MSNGLLGDEDHVGAAGDAARTAAIQPAWRPMTSTTITRLCDSAVVCRRSIASVAICTAVWKPNVKSVAAEVVVDRLGHADDRDAVLRVQPGRDAERVLAADRDQRVEPLALEASRAPARRRPSALNGFVRDVPRIVPPRGRMPAVLARAERR